MYPFFLFLHSFWRWLVLGSLIYAIYLAYEGKTTGAVFTQAANKWRHWTATIAHIQLLLGMAIYVQSPVVLYPMPADPHKLMNEQSFFRYFHIGMMMLAVVLVTVGSAKAKRVEGDREKYSTMLLWFGLALLVIFIAVPWPFSPLASRSFLRSL